MARSTPRRYRRSLLATLQSFPRLPLIGAFGIVAILDAVEWLVHRRANDQGRARISAVKNWKAHERRKFDSKRRAAARNVRFAARRVAIFGSRAMITFETRYARRASGVLPRKGLGGDKLSETIDCRPRRILFERSPRQGLINRTLMPTLERRARPNHNGLIRRRVKSAYPHWRWRRSADGRRIGQGGHGPGRDR